MTNPKPNAFKLSQQVRKYMEQVSVQCRSIEDACQQCARSLHDSTPGVVLTRIYLTQPYQSLPTEVSTFVSTLARSKGMFASLKDTTPVLCLMGTAGTARAWNQRRDSKGHLGIPLLSPEFISEIPMLLALLKALGVPLTWIATQDAKALAEALTDFTSLFYVPDARTTVDDRGRKIIPAQDFVTQYKVQSVIGCGAPYFATNSILVIIQFTTEQLDKNFSIQFAPLANILVSATSKLMLAKKVFTN